jgi:hypothetical protein
MNFSIFKVINKAEDYLDALFLREIFVERPDERRALAMK